MNLRTRVRGGQQELQVSHGRMITLSGERTVLDVLSHGQPCSPPQGQSSSPTRTSPLYLAWLSWPYGKNRESQYLGRLPTSTKLSVIKQNVYLNCEAVRERVIEMNYRKQYWKFTGYLHTCRVQCFLALLFFFPIRITETEVLFMQALCLQKYLLSHISVVFHHWAYHQFHQ